MPTIEAGQAMQNDEEDEEDDGRNAAGLHTIAEEEEIGNGTHIFLLAYLLIADEPMQS